MKLGSIVPAGNGVFAYDCFDSTRACTFDQLRTLLNDDLGGIDAATRVAIAMRNGADLALALLRVMHWAIAVPLCPNSSPAELRDRWLNAARLEEHHVPCPRPLALVTEPDARAYFTSLEGVIEGAERRLTDRGLATDSSEWVALRERPPRKLVATDRPTAEGPPGT